MGTGLYDNMLFSCSIILLTVTTVKPVLSGHPLLSSHCGQLSKSRKLRPPILTPIEWFTSIKQSLSHSPRVTA